MKKLILMLSGLLLLAFGLRYLRLEAGKPQVPSSPRKIALPEDKAGPVGDLMVSQEALELAEIRSERPVLRTVADHVSVQGEILSNGNQLAKVSPRASGKVVRLRVLLGQDVKAGETLAVLESAELAQAQADYQQALARLDALENTLQRQQELARLDQFGRPQVEQSRLARVESTMAVHDASHQIEIEQARLAQSEAERDVLRLNLQRARELNELVSLQDLQRIQADVKKAEAEVLASRARLKGAQGKLRLAQSKLSISQSAQRREERVYAGRYLTSQELVEAESAARLGRVELDGARERVQLLGGTPGQGSEVPLIAPISGKVQEVLVTLGETVLADRVAYTVVDLGRVWAQLALSPKDLARVKLGNTLELKADSAPGRTFRSRVASISPSSDPTTRAVYLGAWLDNPAGLLKIGTAVVGNLITDRRLHKLTVPTTALQEHNGRPTLYVERPGRAGYFEVRHVILGAKTEQWREIRQGLKASEKVAVSGTFYLKSQALKSSLSDGCCGSD